jgi:hypothetical protein
MKNKFNGESDLSHMNHREVIVTSRTIADKTNAEVARDMGIGEETVARYQREPHPGEHDYDLPIRRVRAWNKAVGNNLVIRWLCQQCDGVFAAGHETGKSEVQISDIINKLNRETGDVIQQAITSLRDSKWTAIELKKFLKEVRDVQEMSHTAEAVAKRMLKEAEGKGGQA